MKCCIFLPLKSSSAISPLRKPMKIMICNCVSSFYAGTSCLPLTQLSTRFRLDLSRKY